MKVVRLGHYINTLTADAEKRVEKLDAQDEGAAFRGRKLSDSGAKAKFYRDVCEAHLGRIIDRLVRPKYNAALRFLDEGRATQKDLDLTCKLGLGYPDGPIERVVRGGLVHHYNITSALFEATGASGYAPARRAIVAAKREHN